MMNKFIILIVEMVSWYTYVKIHQFAYFKYVEFIVCQLHLNKAVKQTNSAQILLMFFPSPYGVPPLRSLCPSCPHPDRELLEDSKDRVTSMPRAWHKARSHYVLNERSLAGLNLLPMVTQLT